MTNGGGSCDGSTNEKWGGIQLLNNFNSYSTNPPLLKGTLPHVNFSNGSVMENSQSGIFALANTTDFRGSIWSNDSYFIDNEKSISFFNSSRSPYFNLIFNNTEFLIQDNFEGKFKGFVSLIAANQTTFFDCRFEIKNNQFSNFGTTVGISSFFSDLIVKASSKENGYFKSLRSGIYLYNGAIAEVNNIEFSNCGYGIHSNSSNTLSVQNCEFSSFNYPYLSKRGIFIQEPNLSNLIIGNEFYGNSSNSFYAIHISNSTGFGLIQENVFQDFRYAIFADGSNGRTGLLCNTNNDNISTDFNIVGTIMNPLGSPSVPAGNLFSKNSIAEINYSSGLLEYYYANNDLRQDPEISTGVRKIQTSSPLGCNPPVWNPDLPGIEEEYNDSYTIWNNYKSQLNSLIDGGDPSAIEFLILSASSLSSNDILVELSQHSPYLSANSLALLLSRTDVFSSSEIISILVLNPDVLKEEEFWLDLTSGNFPITSDNLEDLENARHLKTERTDLLAEINMSYSKVMQIVTEGIIFAVNDENSDNFDVRFWSKRLNAFESEINVAYSLFMDGEFDLLNDQIESLKVPGILSSEELSNLIQFEFFLNTLINHKIEGGNLMNLNQSDLQLINNIAIDDFKYVSPLCKTFLELFYGYEFDDSPPSEFKNFSLSNLLNTDKVVSEITIFPNPSEGTIYFNAENISLQLGDIDLQIIDLTGKLVSITSVSINQPIQLDKLSKGIYFYKLTNEHTILTKGKLVIR
ncbi:MAG: T9SS type A sorting domain-containing protein [Saprospiraceae bacterium]